MEEKKLKFCKVLLVFTFILILTNLVAAVFPCNTICTGANIPILNQVWDGRLKGTDCDCSTNSPINFWRVELSCFDISGRACWNKIQSQACVIGCKYLNCQPNWINRQEGSCQTNDQRLISYTDSNSCDKNENLPLDAGWQTCNYCSQNIQGPIYNDWSVCSLDDTIKKTKYYTDLNYNSCCALTSLSSDCEINSPLYTNSTEISSCDFCTPNIVQTNGTCMISDTLISSFNDSNSCYEKTLLDSDKITQNQTLSCDFCTPNWAEVRGACQQDESMFVWFNDTNTCFKKTGLLSDINSKPNNKTLLFTCDYNDDGIIGNINNINTSIANISLKENNQTLFYFEENNQTLFYFDFNRTQGVLNLANIFIERQSLNTSFSYFIIRGLDLTSQNKTKTIYMDRIINSLGVCIKDDEINSISEISESCNGDNETWLACNGSIKNYTCELVNNDTQYKISGLRHSGVKEQETYCGDGTCNDLESCSSCSMDCGACPVETSSSSGGGGGSGSSYVKTIIQNQTNVTNISQETFKEDNTNESNQTSEEVNKGNLARITGAVIGIVNQKKAFVIVLIAILGFLYFFSSKVRKKMKKKRS